jgi:hypothetical protein
MQRNVIHLTPPGTGNSTRHRSRLLTAIAVALVGGVTFWLALGFRRRAHLTTSGVQLGGTLPASPDERLMSPPQPGSVPDPGGRRPWWARFASSPGLPVAVILALWLTAGLWGRGPPSGDDTMAHLIRTEFTLHELVPHARLDGWQPRFGLGYQQFLFYGPGFTWAVVLLHWLSLGLLSLAGAFKVAAIASFVALPLSVAYLAASFGLGRRAAGLAAILVLCVSSPFGGVGLQGTFGIGLIPNQLGAALACLALGAMLRLVADPGPRRVVVAGVALAAVFVTHAISAVILAVLLAVILLTFLGTERLQARTVRCLVGAFVLAGGLAAFWLVPAFAHNNLRGALTSWENPPLAERLADLLAGRLLLHGMLVWLLLAGWLFAVHRFQQRQPWALALVVTPFAYLWVADLFLRWDRNNVISMQLANRGLGYVGVLAVLPFAALLAYAPTQFGDQRRWRVAGEAVTILCAVLLVVGTSGASRDEVVRQQTPTPTLRALAVQLAAHVPDGARFATQRDFPNERRITGVSHPDFWLPWASGRDTLNLFNIESSTTPWPGHVSDDMTKQPPDVAADQLSRLGVTHVAVVNDQAAQPLLASPRFATVWRSPPLALLAVSPRQGQPAPGSLLSAPVTAEARLVRAEAQHLVIKASTGQPTSATIAVAWSPKWHARVNGREAALGRSADGLLMLSLPPDKSTIELVFRPDAWDALGATLTALAIAALAGWAWRRRLGAAKGSQDDERSSSAAGPA